MASTKRRSCSISRLRFGTGLMAILMSGLRNRRDMHAFRMILAGLDEARHAETSLILHAFRAAEPPPPPPPDAPGRPRDAPPGCAPELASWTL